MKRFALIDIGSNSVKCNLYEASLPLKLLLSQSRTLGLIRYVEGERMGQGGIRVLLDTISEYQNLADELRCEQVFCVATASLRGLTNGEEIVRAVEQLGCRMRIISGKEEAELGFRAVKGSISLAGRGIVIDMGGASTELTAFENGEIRHFISLNLGCLSLYRDYVSGVLPNGEERRAIRERAKQLLCGLDWLPRYGENLYLVGGTGKMLGKILAPRADLTYENGMRFSEKALEALYEAYKKPGKRKIGAMIEASPDRLHTFLPGLIAYRTIAKQAGAQTITVTFATLREGMARWLLEGDEEHAEGSKPL